ncbi:MAG: hypothetical protein RSC29_04550 [Oscillospiraceae bacterium]
MANLTTETTIKRELLDKFPNWCKDFEPTDYYTVLTDDCDSIFSCQRLRTLFGIEIGGFFDFKKGLFLNKEITDNGWKTPIFVDLSVSEGYAFDNHYSFIQNPNKVNPNILKLPKYNHKYCGSTLMLLVALYGGIEKMNETLRTVMLCCDGFYIGYYKDNGRWNYVNKFWLEELGLSDYLLPILEAHDKEYFVNFINKYQMQEKVCITNDGYLMCPAFGVPGIQFNKEHGIEQLFTDKVSAMRMYKNGSPIFISASTYENSYVLNLKKIS